MTRTLRIPVLAGEVEQADAAPKSTDRKDASSLEVVSASDNSAGVIGYDDLGQPRWTWITEIESAAAKSVEDTFDYLKALDNDSLAIVDGPVGRDRRRASKDSGYDPYDTARIKIKGRFPGR